VYEQKTPSRGWVTPQQRRRPTGATSTRESQDNQQNPSLMFNPLYYHKVSILTRPFGGRLAFEALPMNRIPPHRWASIATFTDSASACLSLRWAGAGKQDYPAPPRKWPASPAGAWRQPAKCRQQRSGKTPQTAAIQPQAKPGSKTRPGFPSPWYRLAVRLNQTIDVKTHPVRAGTPPL